MDRKILLVSIDPSMRNLGYAVHAIIDWNKGKLVEVGAIKNSEKEGMSTWHHIALSTAAMVSQTVERFLAGEDYFIPYIVVVTELQEVFHGPKGVAAMDAGMIQKLYFFTGLMISRLLEVQGVTSIWGVTPTHWKGQVPKDIMMKRAIAYAEQQGQGGGKDFTHDAAEAVLIGKYALSKLTWERRSDSWTQLGFNQHIELICKTHEIIANTEEHHVTHTNTNPPPSHITQTIF